MGEGVTAVSRVLAANSKAVELLAASQDDIKQSLQELGKGEHMARLFYMLEDCQATLKKVTAEVDDIRSVGKGVHDNAGWVQQGVATQLGPEDGERIGQTIVDATHHSNEQLHILNDATFDPLHSSIATALTELAALRSIFLTTADGVGENAATLHRTAAEVFAISKRIVS